VLHIACAAAAGWPGQLRVAVNLSPVQFGRLDLPQLVENVLRDNRLATERLELEITEGVLIKDLDQALSVLRRLKA
jgi:EAL domain-containing protein (putative c-di-GMP-specific phosphodiesterase class I)